MKIMIKIKIIPVNLNNDNIIMLIVIILIIANTGWNRREPIPRWGRNQSRC